MTLFFALLLDAYFGEPKQLWDRWPHPAVLMGRLIDWCDNALNNGPNRKAKGCIAVIGILIVAIITGQMIHWLPDFGLIELFAVAVLLAHRSLTEHVSDVAEALAVSLSRARKSVAMIVGRDTKEMTAPDVARGAIESAAENFSDGVVAPAFWYLVGGLPGMIAYKFVNTADSMIGYRSEEYREFGWAAARLDDLMNWVPARLTALFFLLVSHDTKNWADVKKDAHQHRSPNAGWPEAALAKSLGFALSGPRSYDGTMTTDAYVNPAGKQELNEFDIKDTIIFLWKSWVVLVGFAAISALMGLIF